MLCRSLPSHECVSCRADCFVCCYVERVCVVWRRRACHEDEMESASTHQLLSRVYLHCEDNVESASAHQLLSSVYMHCEDDVESASAMKTRWRACLMEYRRGGVVYRSECVVRASLLFPMMMV